LDDVKVISSLKAIKALSDPVRLRIIHALQQTESASASELGEKIGLPPSNISYHLKILEKQGLAGIAETRMKGNLAEHIYAAAARNFIIQKSLVEEVGAEGREDILRIKNEISAIITHDITAAGSASVVFYEDYYMTKAEAEALHNEMSGRLREFAGRKPGPGLSLYGAGFLLIGKNGGKEDEEE
jgi:DNA-binding transcriptional ArsR family regulator